MNDQKMKSLASHTQELIRQKKNLIGICLGHQSIARGMGMQVGKMDEPKQGEQEGIYINGAIEKL